MFYFNYIQYQRSCKLLQHHQDYHSSLYCYTNQLHQFKYINLSYKNSHWLYLKLKKLQALSFKAKNKTRNKHVKIKIINTIIKLINLTFRLFLNIILSQLNLLYQYISFELIFSYIYVQPNILLKHLLILFTISFLLPYIIFQIIFFQILYQFMVILYFISQYIILL